jgi:hypothetical protein
MGDTMEPCGTHDSISLCVDSSPSTETLNFLRERKELISLSKLVKNFNSEFLYSKPRFHVLSNAISMSKNTAAVDMLLLKSKVTWSWLSYPFNCFPYTVVAWTSQERKYISHVEMRVYWPSASHWAWRRPHRKQLFYCPLRSPGTDHSRKHRLSTVVWRHRVCENMFSARCIAMVRARTTENTAPVLLAARVLRTLPSNGFMSHSIFL